MDLDGKDGAPNYSQGVGPVHRTRHQIKATFDSEAACTTAIDRIFQSLIHFGLFAFGRNKTAMICPMTRPSDGASFILFSPKGWFGALAAMTNGRWVPVRTWCRRSLRQVTGDTTGRHMLAGQRRWQCEIESPTVLVVVTESYDQPRGRFNWLGFRVLGKAAQLKVWTEYFDNIAAYLRHQLQAADTGHVTYSWEQIDGANPWTPPPDYPGAEVP